MPGVVTPGIVFDGMGSYLGSGIGAVKNVGFKLPNHILRWLTQFGVFSEDQQPTADAWTHLFGKGAKAINVLETYPKIVELRDAVASAGKKDPFFDATLITSKVSNLMNSGLDAIQLLAKGVVVQAAKQVSSVLLSVGMAALSGNQIHKIVSTTRMFSALKEYQAKHGEKGYNPVGPLKGKKELLDFLSAEEIKDVKDAIWARNVNHYLKLAQWVSFVALGVIGILTFIAALPLSPLLALIASTSVVFFSIVSGLHEHIKVKAAFNGMSRNQMILAKEFAPKEMKANLDKSLEWEKKLSGKDAKKKETSDPKSQAA